MAFHVPSSQLVRVLGDLAAALKHGSVLFCSNPRGNNEEGWSGGRYSCFHDLETWRVYVTTAGFREQHYYYHPPGRPRAEPPWLATVWRKCPGIGPNSGLLHHVHRPNSQRQVDRDDPADLVGAPEPRPVVCRHRAP